MTEDGRKVLCRGGPGWSVTRVKNGDVLLDYLVGPRRKRCEHGGAEMSVLRA